MIMLKNVNLYENYNIWPAIVSPNTNISNNDIYLHQKILYLIQCHKNRSSMCMT